MDIDLIYKVFLICFDVHINLFLILLFYVVCSIYLLSFYLFEFI